MPRLRRRNYYNPDEVDPDSNEARQAEANQINYAALAQQSQVEGEPIRYANDRQRNLAIATADSTERAGNEGMALLANSLGLQETRKGLMSERIQRPRDGVLKAAYYALPEDKQAELYVKGAAPFVDGTTGMKMLENSAKAKDASFHSQVNEMGNRIASGKVFFENDEHGTPIPYSITEDPNVSEADRLMGKGKVKKPLGMMELHILDQGMKRGFLPDIDTLRGKTKVAPAAAVTVANLADAKIQKSLSSNVEAEIAKGIDPGVARSRQIVRDAAFANPLEREQRQFNAPIHIRNAVKDVYNSAVGVGNDISGLVSKGLQFVSGSPIQLPQRPMIPIEPVAFGDYATGRFFPKAPVVEPMDYGNY